MIRKGDGRGWGEEREEKGSGMKEKGKGREGDLSESLEEATEASDVVDEGGTLRRKDEMTIVRKDME